MINNNFYCSYLFFSIHACEKIFKKDAIILCYRTPILPNGKVIIFKEKL